MEPAYLPRDAHSARQYSRWSGRFTWAAIIQGAAVAVLTALLAAITAWTAYPFKLVEMMLATPAIGFSEVTALAGLCLYLVVGVIGTGLSAQFYHHFESRTGRPYRGAVTNALAWSHVVLVNVSVATASLLMIYAGFMGDFAVTPPELGGLEMTMEQASQQIMNPLVVPVAAMLLVTVAGSIAGGAGFVVNYFKRRALTSER